MKRIGITWMGVFVAALLSPLVLYADEWAVPDDPECSTIQTCIVQASPGDTITVLPGTYMENLDFLGKAITVRSQAGPDATVIDGGGSGPLVTMHSGETLSSVLEGFTLSNGGGAAEISSLGIYCENASPTIRGNKVTDNLGMPDVIGILVLNGNPVIQDNLVADNVAYTSSPQVASSAIGIQVVNMSPGSGPVRIRRNRVERNIGSSIVGPPQYQYCYSTGIAVLGGEAEVVNNIVAEQYPSAPEDLALGTGILVSQVTSVSVLHNTVVGNGIGINFTEFSGGTAELSNSIMFSNSSTGLCSDGTGTLTADYNDVWGNREDYCTGMSPGPNDVAADPLLLLDYHLQPNSPCIDAGTDAGVGDDFDGDGRPAGDGFDMGADEAIAGSGPRVSFRVAGNYAVSFPSFMAMGDMDGDAHTDLVVASYPQIELDDGFLSILSGDGAGRFQHAQDMYQGSNPWMLAVTDANEDSQTDLVVANDSDDPSSLSLLLGNEDVTFQASDVTLPSVEERTSTFALGDLNRDAHTDIVAVREESEGKIFALLGNGDGTFQDVIVSDAGRYPRNPAITDVDHDLIPDVVLISDYPEGVLVLRGKGDGTFQAAEYYQAGINPCMVAAGDLTGDGHPDLAVANCGDYEPSQGSISLLAGNGDGTFQTAVDAEEVSGYIFWLALEDFDGDDRLDLAATLMPSNLPLPGKVVICLGREDGTLERVATYNTGVYPRKVAAGDLNADGRPDLAVTGSANSRVTVYLNTPPAPPAWGAASVTGGEGSHASRPLNCLLALALALGAIAAMRRPSKGAPG